MEQWNTRPPLLYLWSHPDWSAKHRLIAKNQGHISKLELEPGERSHYGPMISDELTGNHDDGNCDVYNHPMGGDEDPANVQPQAMDEDGFYGDKPMLNDDPMETDNLNGYTDAPFGTKGHKESSPSSSSDAGNPRSHGHGKKPFSERSRKWPRKARKNKRRLSGRVLTEKREDGGRPPVREIHDARIPSYMGECENIHHHPEPYIPASHAPHIYDGGTGGRSPVREIHNTRMPYYTGISESIHQHPDPSIPVSHVPHPAYDGRFIDDDEHFPRFPDRLSSDLSAITGYEVQNLDERRFIAQEREATDGLNSRHVDESIRSQLRHYGQQDPSLPASSYSPSQDMRFSHFGLAPFSSGYGPMGTVADPLYRMSPTRRTQMPWYHTRSDELHLNRMSTFGSEPVQPAPYGSGGLGPSGFGPPRPPHYGPPGGSAAFAPGRHNSYQHHGSGGWIP